MTSVNSQVSAIRDTVTKADLKTLCGFEFSLEYILEFWPRDGWQFHFWPEKLCVLQNASAQRNFKNTVNKTRAINSE